MSTLLHSLLQGVLNGNNVTENTEMDFWKKSFQFFFSVFQLLLLYIKYLSTIIIIITVLLFNSIILLTAFDCKVICANIIYTTIHIQQVAR